MIKKNALLIELHLNFLLLEAKMKTILIGNFQEDNVDAGRSFKTGTFNTIRCFRGRSSKFEESHAADINL